MGNFLFFLSISIWCWRFLVYVWLNVNEQIQSRPIFQKSTRFEDMRRYDDERAPYRRPQMKKWVLLFPFTDDLLDGMPSKWQHSIWVICPYSVFLFVMLFLYLGLRQVVLEWNPETMILMLTSLSKSTHTSYLSYTRHLVPVAYYSPFFN